MSLMIISIIARQTLRQSWPFPSVSPDSKIHCMSESDTTSDIKINEESMDALDEYCAVSIAYEYDRILDCTLVENGLGGIVLTERLLDAPAAKDYDVLESPRELPRRFDISNWALLVARHNQRCVGGAILAFDCAQVNMLDGRRDLAVLWDIRIDTAFRARGLGSQLFASAESWARARGCTQLKIETQNTNPVACHFYERQGCRLGAINKFAYPNLPDEVQLFWYKDL